MGMTDEELNALVEKKLLERKAEIVQALKTFNRRPSAKTFKEAENTPDRLLGQAMDDIVAEVLQKTVGDVRIERPAKKNSGTTGKGCPTFSSSMARIPRLPPPTICP